MLNISNNRIYQSIEKKNFRSLLELDKRRSKWRTIYAFLIIFLIFLILLFLPWTQNVRAKGYITTIKPDQRPQAIQPVISGRLEKWFVKEGDFVHKGDTIIYITEVKDNYFDPNLLVRTKEQVVAKEQSVGSYNQKAQALTGQYQALTEARDYKIAQTKNKIQQTRFKLDGLRADLYAAQTDNQIALKQLNRIQELYDQGIKSLTDLEAKKLKFQQTQAKVISLQNKLLSTENELSNLQIDLSGIQSEYADKLAKSQSERLSAVTSSLDAAASTAKLKNQLGNYNQRQQYYYITAPQSGYVTKAIQKGVGEIVKEGTDVVTIMPEKIDIAVEVYVKPIDVPLMKIGEEVRLQFDGWPAIVFSGWPDASLGTFTGKIVAIDRFISDNGRYRLMVAPNDENKPWPDLIRVGSGANAFVLLKNVPIWYELWRQLNGFPPDFYQGKEGQESLKKKAPLKSVK